MTSISFTTRATLAAPARQDKPLIYMDYINHEQGLRQAA
jgi:hypothetical protein